MMRTARTRPNPLWSLLRATLLDWYEDRAQRLGAALAYYTIFALAPGLIIVMALAGMLLGPGAEQQILLQVQELIGEQGATAIAALIQNARGETLGATGTALALIPLIFGLWWAEHDLGRDAQARPPCHRHHQATLLVVRDGGRHRLCAARLARRKRLARRRGDLHWDLLPAPALVLETVNFVLSLVVITASFALIFKLLPDVHVAWSDVWLGAALTSFFFTLGKFVIGLYLGKSAVASAYGAASSLVIVVVWVYYSAQILLFGAEFTKVWTRRRGGGAIPEKTAVPITQEARAEQGLGPRPAV